VISQNSTRNSVSPSPTTEAVHSARVLLGGLKDEGSSPRDARCNKRIAAKRYCAVTRQRAIERTDDSRSGNSTTARNAERPEAARPTRPSYVLRTRPRDKGDSDAANINSVPHGSQSSRRQPRLPAHRRTRRSSLIVNRGSTTSAGSMPQVFAGTHRMMLLLGGTGLGCGGFFRLLLCVSFG
jgi:hypothetical protein